MRVYILISVGLLGMCNAALGFAPAARMPASRSSAKVALRPQARIGFAKALPLRQQRAVGPLMSSTFQESETWSASQVVSVSALRCPELTWDMGYVDIRQAVDIPMLLKEVARLRSCCKSTIYYSNSQQ
eukprot:726803-Rhodomonas_salina.1